MKKTNKESNSFPETLLAFQQKSFMAYTIIFTSIDITNWLPWAVVFAKQMKLLLLICCFALLKWCQAFESTIFFLIINVSIDSDLEEGDLLEEDWLSSKKVK